MRLSFRGGATPIENVLEVGGATCLLQRQKDEPGGKSYINQRGRRLFLTRQASLRSG